MELRQLKYFLAVAEEGLITRAAERLHITQSPLSQQMLLLERELGVTLFRRTKKHLFLTEAGQVLKRRAEQILDLDQAACSEVRETARGACGKLTLGIINSAGSPMFPEFIQKFHRHYPGISFDLRQGDTPHILELLNAHLLDLGFVRLPVDPLLYEVVPIPPENMALAISPQLLGKTKTAQALLKDSSLPLLKFQSYPLLLHRRYQAAVLSYFHQNGLEPDIFCTSDEVIPLLTWSSCDLGAAIVPEQAARLLGSSSLIVKKIAQPVLTTSSALIWRKSEVLPAAADHFIQLFRDRDQA